MLDLNKRLVAVEKRVPPESNPYQALWGEIYRRFRVSSYKLIPQSQYTAVVQFLSEWAERVLRDVGETG